MAKKFADIVSWDSKAVINQAKAILERNADQVGDFIEQDARRRLDSIVTPSDRRSRNYRYYLSRYILDHTVKSDDKNIRIFVGMKIGKYGQRHHGYYIETGSTTAPAQPYLRPALFSNKKRIPRMLVE